MAICRICKQEMTTAAGCSASLVTIVESVFSVSPKKYERIRFASERDSLPGIHQRCPSCGALPGYFHRVFIFLGGFLFTNRWFPKIYQKKRRWFLLQTTFFYVTMTDREFLFSNRWFL